MNMDERIASVLTLLSRRAGALDMEAVAVIRELRKTASPAERTIMELGHVQRELDDVEQERNHWRTKCEGIQADLNVARAEIDRLELIMDLGVDSASIQGHMRELTEVAEKLAKLLGRQIQGGDTPLLLAEEVKQRLNRLHDRVAALEFSLQLNRSNSNRLPMPSNVWVIANGTSTTSGVVSVASSPTYAVGTTTRTLAHPEDMPKTASTQFPGSNDAHAAKLWGEAVKEHYEAGVGFLPEKL